MKRLNDYMPATEMTIKDKGELASIIIQLLDTWEVSSSDQIILLSLPEKTPTRAIRKYRQCTPFPENDVLNEKLDHIVGIAEALRTTYPRNANMGPQWMNKPHKRFGGRSALRVMLDDGIKGFITVRAQLDCAFAWENYDK